MGKEAHGVEKIAEALAGRGHRLTPTRRAVLETLAAAPAPASARAVHETVGPGRADLVTVYRALRWLVERGAARVVASGPGPERYELARAGAHTHLLRCDRCGAVRTVPLCGVDPALAERIDREYAFSVFRHSLTFHGLCAHCAGVAGLAAAGDAEVGWVANK